MAILRARKDVMLLKEKGDMAILRARKDVMLLREKGDMAIVRVRKDVMLLREEGKMVILFSCKTEKFHRTFSVYNFKHDHSGFESQKVFQSNLRPKITSIVS